MKKEVNHETVTYNGISHKGRHLNTETGFRLFFTFTGITSCLTSMSCIFHYRVLSSEYSLSVVILRLIPNYSQLLFHLLLLQSSKFDPLEYVNCLLKNFWIALIKPNPNSVGTISSFSQLPIRLKQFWPIQFVF